MAEEKQSRLKGQPLRGQASPKNGPVLKNGGSEARKIGALVLEVLAGELRPVEAAAALEVGLMRYYQLEKQALEGLLSACEPRGKGRRPKSAEKLLAEKDKEKNGLERDLHRTQALLRAAQKIAGVMQAVKKETPGGRKRRKPEVRALKIARNLAKPVPAAAEAPSAPSALPTPNPASTPVGESV